LDDREVEVVDIPGAFMQADMDAEPFVRLSGRLIDMLVGIDEEMYAGYVTIENGRKVMYVELTKALFGTRRAARLLVEWGFEINPYDTCIADKFVDGKSRSNN
jgi:hypothetical protein